MAQQRSRGRQQQQDDRGDGDAPRRRDDGAHDEDEHGQVALDALSERARRNYFYARVVVGREYAAPAVVRTDD